MNQLRCPCGGPTVRVTYEGDRGIHDVPTNVVAAPLEVVCEAGHEQERWVTQDVALEYIRSVTVAAK